MAFFYMLNDSTCFSNMLKKVDYFNILFGYVEGINISL